MDIGELKQTLQDHFTDGLVTIVGTGLSIAEGVPGMEALAKHLLNEVPPQLPVGSTAAWNQITAELAIGTDMETTLLKRPPDAELESLSVPTYICVKEGLHVGLGFQVAILAT